MGSKVIQVTTILEFASRQYKKLGEVMAMMDELHQNLLKKCELVEGLFQLKVLRKLAKPATILWPVPVLHRSS